MSIKNPLSINMPSSSVHLLFLCLEIHSSVDNQMWSSLGKKFKGQQHMLVCFLTRINTLPPPQMFPLNSFKPMCQVISFVQHFPRTHLYLERRIWNMCKNTFRRKVFVRSYFLACAHLTTHVRTRVQLTGTTTTYIYTITTALARMIRVKVIECWSGSESSSSMHKQALHGWFIPVTSSSFNYLKLRIFYISQTESTGPYKVR